MFQCKFWCIREIKESFGGKVSLRVQFNQLYDIGGTCSLSSTCSPHTTPKTKTQTLTYIYIHRQRQIQRQRQRQTAIHSTLQHQHKYSILIKSVTIFRLRGGGRYSYCSFERSLGRQKIRCWDFVVKAIFAKSNPMETKQEKTKKGDFLPTNASFLTEQALRDLAVNIDEGGNIKC